MITLVNEPQAEYTIVGWQTESKVFPFDDFICGIENETILICPPSGSTLSMFFEKPRRKNKASKILNLMSFFFVWAQRCVKTR